MLTTFIFDLDGVIVDTAKYHFLAWKKLADELGIPFTEKDNEHLKGVSRRRSLELVLELGNRSMSEEEIQNCLQEKNEDYLNYIEKMDESEILPGSVEVLDFLKKENYKIALGSASKNAQFILKQVGLTNYFDAIIDGNKVSQAKPDPEVFILGAKETNSKPEECVVFEDAIAGVQAANNAGMISIGIGEKDVLNEADYVFSGLAEITPEFLKELKV